MIQAQSKGMKRIDATATNFFVATNITPTTIYFSRHKCQVISRIIKWTRSRRKKIAARLRSPIGNLVEKNVLKNTSFQTNNIHLFSGESNKAR